MGFGFLSSEETDSILSAGALRPRVLGHPIETMTTRVLEVLEWPTTL